MKTLETNFVSNADKSGNNRFIQLRKLRDVALYRRERMDGSLVGFEIFNFKVVQAGASLPGGGTVEETYESYPGGKAFGRSAWFIGGNNAEKRANERFETLVNGKTKTPSVEVEEIEPEIEVAPVVPVARVAKGEVTLKLPDKPFTQKELASWNGIENYKEVYSHLQKMLKSGVLRVVGEKTAGRGKSAKLFGKV